MAVTAQAQVSSACKSVTTSERDTSSAVWREMSPPSLEQVVKRYEDAGLLLVEDGIPAEDSSRSPPSPPKLDPLPEAYRRDAKDYMRHLRHDYDQSLRLPLWKPAKVELGAIGYIDKTTLSFVTIFNAFDLEATAHGELRRACPVCPKVQGNAGGKMSQEDRHRAHGDRNISQFLAGKRRYIERYTCHARASLRQAFLIAPETSFRHLTCDSGAKTWFREYIQLIIATYGPLHGIGRENVIFVTGKLDARKWAMAVNEGSASDDFKLQLNVVPRLLRHRRPWARFSQNVDSSKTRTRVSLREPEHREDWDSLLLTGLRFQAGNAEPTHL